VTSILSTAWQRLITRGRRFMDEELRALAVHTMWMWTATGSKILMGMAQVAIVTRSLGRETYGRLALVMSVTEFVTLILSMRVWEWVTKFFSDACEANSATEASAVVKLGYSLSALVNLSSVTIIIATAQLFAAWLYHDASLTKPIALYSLTLLATWANDTSTAVLRVFTRFRFLAVYGIFATIARLALIATPLLLGYRLTGLVLSFVASEALLAFAILAITSIELHRRFGMHWWRGSFSALAAKKRELRSMIAFAFGIDTVKSLAGQAGIMILGHYSDAGEVAFFRIAETFIDLVNRLAATLLQVGYTALARLAARRDVQALRRLVRRSTVVVFALVTPLCLAITLLSPWLVRMAAGSEFDGGVPVLRVFSWSLMWIVTYWPIALCMSVGRPGLAMEFVVITSLIRVIAILPGALRFGAVGVAWAETIYSASFVLGSFVYYARVKRFLEDVKFAAPVARAS
jgi:O-antigen/teichoic acid export membrane protein